MGRTRRVAWIRWDGSARWRVFDAGRPGSGPVGGGYASRRSAIYALREQAQSWTDEAFTHYLSPTGAVLSLTTRYA